MTMIMAQHLVLSTQRKPFLASIQLKQRLTYTLNLGPDGSPSGNLSSSREPVSLVRPPPKSSLVGTDSGNHRPVILTQGSRGYGHGFGGDAFELGVRVQMDTHIDKADGSDVQTVKLHRVDSHSSTTGASGKGVPVQYDVERGDDRYDYDDAKR